MKNRRQNRGPTPATANVDGGGFPLTVQPTPAAAREIKSRGDAEWKASQTAAGTWPPKKTT